MDTQISIKSMVKSYLRRSFVFLSISRRAASLVSELAPASEKYYGFYIFQNQESNGVFINHTLHNQQGQVNIQDARNILRGLQSREIQNVTDK